MLSLRQPLLVLLAIACAVAPSSLSAQRIVATDATIYPYMLTLDAVANRIYLSDESSNSIDVIDGSTNQLITRVDMGTVPGRPVVNSATNNIYTVLGRQNVLKVIDGSTFSVSTVNVGIGPAAVAVNTVTNKIYVANSDDNTVTVVDGVTLATTTVPVDEGPLAIAVNSVTNKIYVGNQRFVGGSSITVIDGATNHTTTFALGPGAFNYGADTLLVNPANNKIYAVGYYYLYSIDGSTNAITPYQWGNSGCHESIALNTTTNHVYAPDSCSFDVVDIDPLFADPTLLYAGHDYEYVSVDSVRNRLYLGGSYDFTMSIMDLNSNAVTTFSLSANSFNLVTNSATNTTYLGSGYGFTAIGGASPMQFVPVAPCRVFDSRTGGGPIQGGTAQNVPMTSPDCHIPASASAYSLNVTLVPANGPVSYLTIWPTDQIRPTVSTMNSLDGRVKANAAIVAAGTLGAVSVFVSDTTDAVIDVNGYFLPNSGSTLAFYPLTPCRVFDTRNSNGDLGGPYLKGGHERDFPLRESPCIPQGVTPQAYSLNFTAVPHQDGQSLSYLTVWPQGQTKPLVSTLNNPTATIVANAAVVPAGLNGAIAVFPSDDTQLVADINGYFAAPGQGGLSLYSAAPSRVLDTRQSGGAFDGELTVDLTNGRCAPAAARAYIFNATVVPPGSFGYLTLYPDGQDRPMASTLNAIDGAITSNMAIVPSTNGCIDAYASGITQLILDVSSYFAP